MGIFWYDYKIGQKLEVETWRREEGIFEIRHRLIDIKEGHYLPHRYYQGIFYCEGEARAMEFSERRLRRMVKRRREQ